MTFCGEEEWRSGMRKAQPKGGLTKGFYSLEKYRHSLETVSYTHLDVYKRQGERPFNPEKGGRVSLLKIPITSPIPDPSFPFLANRTGLKP